jgi:hypothetical protein
MARKLKISFIVISLLLLVGILFFIYSSFIYYTPCNTESCFFAHLKNCDRASFFRSGDLSIDYEIQGYSFNGCQVELSLRNSTRDIGLREIYQNSEMVCNAKIGSNYYPEEDLERCSGMLKEGLQEVLIDRLKVEIARNIGDLNTDILSG